MTKGGQYTFKYICNIEPELDGHGAIKKYRPQSRYNNVKGYLLNKYGKGSFCKFRVLQELYTCGIYAILVNEELKYIGECVDLSDRFNAGYGQISPRNCYEGGQETNCRINKNILMEATKDNKISLWFYKTKKNKLIEKQILEERKPPWIKYGIAKTTSYCPSSALQDPS